MRFRRQWGILSPPSGDPQDPPAFKHENTPDNLKKLFEKLHQAISSGDEKAALALTTPLLPDEAAVKKGMKDDVPADLLAKSVEFWSKMLPADDSKKAKLFTADPANTDVRIHSATTEDILKYEKGSVAFMQFPGGTKRLAELVLRPGMTYHEVVLAKPGAELGMKFHLFYWTGDRWCTLGPLWRVIK
jgi:hypothetical protein